MSTKPIMVKGKMVGFIQTYEPDGWGTPEFDAKFPPVMGESYLQRIRREYDPEDKAMPDWQPGTSFPFLKIARDYNCDYGAVIRASDIVWSATRKVPLHVLAAKFDMSDLMKAILCAVISERKRRNGGHIYDLTNSEN